MSEDVVKTENPFDQGFYETPELRRFGFRSVGENVKIAKNCTIIGTHNISIGDNVRIDANTLIACARGELVLGDYIHIGGGSHLACIGGIYFEDFAAISQGVRIYSGTDDYSGMCMTNPTVPSEFLGMHCSPVYLRKHSIVGTGSTLMPGVTLGEGCAVGAMSLVTLPLDPWTVNFGIPAKFLKKRSRKLLELEIKLKEKLGKN